MDGAETVRALPRAYRVALALEELGADHALIAECLGVDRQTIPALLEIGHRKLVEVEAVGDGHPDA